MDNAIKILIGADIVPTESSSPYFSKADMNALVGDKLLEILKDSDIRIFNLETPLADRRLPIAKHGPDLCAETSTINGIKALNPTFLTLANNHILDQGMQGLESTMTVLTQAGIAFAGVGNCSKDMVCTWITEIRDIKIGVYVCAEHEFSISTEKTAGAHAFDPLESYDIVRNLKEQCDYLLVLYHGGRENYRYPSPNLQRYCRKFVDRGADLVVCQHSHCIGCEEQYKKGIIVYGQGNFLFDKRVNECWETSFLIRVEMGENHKVTYIPLVRNEHGVRLADEERANEILEKYRMRSREILDADFIKDNYNKFAKESVHILLRRMDLNSDDLMFKALNKISLGKLEDWYFKSFLKRKRLQLLNTVECEAWQELLVQLLKNGN